MAATREKMQILVKNLMGETTIVEVESSETVGNLRAKLQQKPGIFLQSSADEQQDVSFKFGPKIMDDDRITLGAFNIQQGSTVEVIMRVRGGASSSNPNRQNQCSVCGKERETMAARRGIMQILVRNLMGETTIVEVESSETVGNLRAKLQQKPGIFLQSSADGQQDVSFKFGTKIMDDDRITLGYYNIQQGSTVEVIMRVRGGASSSNPNCQNKMSVSGKEKETMAARRGKMQILVRNLMGETTIVEVESSETVGNLRAKLQQKPGIFLQSSADGQQDVSFKFGTKIMDDDRIPLGAFNIQQGSTVEVIMRVRGGAAGYNNVQIQSVRRNKEKQVSERKLVVDVYSPATENYTRLELEKDHATVDYVKERVLREEGVKIPKEEAQLSYNGSVLEDGNRKLLDYKIRKDWTDLKLEWKVEGEDSEEDEDEE